jgi:hypothetical protein
MYAATANSLKVILLLLFGFFVRELHLPFGNAILARLRAIPHL